MPNQAHTATPHEQSPRVPNESQPRPQQDNYPRAKKTQLASQMWQLSTMVEAGIGLAEALDCLARQGTDPRLQALLGDTSDQVKEGSTLSDAMARYPRSYPASLVAMIRAAEHSGSLAKVLRQCSVYLDKDLRIVAKMKGAMIYPALLLTVTSTVMIFLLTFVLPKFSVVFTGRGVELPLMTKVFLNMSQSLTTQWTTWAASALAAITLLWLIYHSNAGRRRLDRVLVTAPGLSILFNALYQSRAFRALSMLIDAKVPLIDAVPIVREIVPNTAYREMWDELESQMRMGEHFAAPLFATGFIEESIAQMIDKGDRSGKLANAFARVADYLEEKYERSVTSAMQFVEPVMLLTIGGLIGVVVISMMLPLFRSAQVVAGS